MSDSLRLHGLEPTRLLCPWDFPGKNTGVDCHFLLQCMKVKSESEITQSCPTLCDPMDWSLPGSSVHGIFQARVLEWDAIAFSEITAHEYKLKMRDNNNIKNGLCLLFRGYPGGREGKSQCQGLLSLEQGGGGGKRTHPLGRGPGGLRRLLE